MPRTVEGIGAVVCAALGRPVKIARYSDWSAVHPADYHAVVRIYPDGLVLVERDGECDDQRQSLVDGYTLQVLVMQFLIDPSGETDLDLVAAFREGFGNIRASAELKAALELGRLN